MKKWWALIFALLVLCTMPQVGANGITTVSVSPSTKTVSTGESFAIEITTTPAQPITGVQVILHFDAAILSVEGVAQGDLLGSSPFYVIQIDNENGIVTVAGTTLGGATISSPGVFATITFHADNAGSTALALENVMVVTVENGAVVQVPSSASNGSVTVQSSGQVENENDNVGSGENISVYDDFNDGELDTNLGGMAGPMSPGAAYDPVVDFTSSAAEGAYALSLTYNFPSGQWCGYWSFANDDNPDDNTKETIDASGYNSIKFYLKGALGGERFKVEVTDSVFDPSSQASYLATQGHKGQFYVQATTSWQDVEIQLSDLTANTDLDLSQLRQINIVFDKSPRSGTVYIDKIRFTGVGVGGDNEGQGSGENQSNTPPTAYIDFISHPATTYENSRVIFSGHGVDSDGTVTGYLWTSSIDGPLSSSATFDTVVDNLMLSPGTHQIRFKVMDDKGAWSSEATAMLTVTSSVSLGGVPDGTLGGASGSPSGGSNEKLILLLSLEAAVVAALISVIVIKKFGYLKPAIEHIYGVEERPSEPIKLAKPTVGRIYTTERPVKPMKSTMEHIPRVKLSSAERIAPWASLHDLAREVHYPRAKYPFKEQVPKIPKEKWSELQMRLRRLMNSRRKLS